MAPDGCTQYFFGETTDIVKTFNFSGGQHLASQDQNICVRYAFYFRLDLYNIFKRNFMLGVSEIFVKYVGLQLLKEILNLQDLKLVQQVDTYMNYIHYRL